MPLTWASFNNAPRRIQNGGWARQVTQDSFAVASTISGVNMRLTSGGIREMHWHQFAEWAYMTYGTCRITILDEQGRPYIADVKEGDLWYFPAGLPHSLQGLGDDGCEFVICFDEGSASEFSTLLVSEWFTHTPPDILGLNFGVPPNTFQNIPLRDLYIFQGKLPGDLAAERDAVSGRGVPPHPFTFTFGSGAPTRATKGGTVHIADSRNFTVSTTIAAALLTIHPGAMREMHWHPNADEWQYWIKGKGQMTVFNTGPNAVTMDFNPGDIGYVKKNLGHYIKNTGDSDLQVLEVFRAPHFADVSLSDWITHTPAAMVAQHLNVSEQTIATFPRNKPEIVPI
jgi:oxalate decarboxylase